MPGFAAAEITPTGTLGNVSDPMELTEAVEPHVRRMRQRAMSERLRESLLFLPGCILAVAVLLALTTAELDRRGWADWLDPFEMPPDSAVTLLSTLAGATITTAGVVFSLLVVTLQLASGQFSPRVLRTFWRDRFGQVLIGLLLATFLFCVLGLTQIDTSSDHAPTLTVVFSLLLSLASITAIVIYLNRISRNQYVGRIAERIAGETLTLIEQLPYGPLIGARVGEPVPAPDEASLGTPLVVAAPADGWVQQISRRAVMAAVPPGTVLRLETRVGAYLVRGEPFATLWPRPDDPADADRIAGRLGEAFILGYARTMQQDIDFGLRQLNDIALRALSAAVNDQTTAIEIVLRVSSVMRPLLLADLPDQSVRDADGRILLTPWNLDHAEYVHHAFDQLRLYAAPHPQVALAMQRSTRMLARVADSAGRTEAAAVLHTLTGELTEFSGKSDRSASGPAASSATA